MARSATFFPDARREKRGSSEDQRANVGNARSKRPMLDRECEAAAVLEENTHDLAVETHPDLTGGSIARIPHIHLEAGLQNKRILDFSTQNLEADVSRGPEVFVQGFVPSGDD